MFLVALSIFISIMLQSTVTTLPLVLLIILFLSVVNRSNDVFLIAFLSGLFLDLLTLGRFGVSSLFFITFVFIIYSYQRRFEIETLHFVIIFSLVGSLIYLMLTGSDHAVSQTILATIISSLSFMVFKKFNKKTPKYLPAGRQGV